MMSKSASKLNIFITALRSAHLYSLNMIVFILNSLRMKIRMIIKESQRYTGYIYRNFSKKFSNKKIYRDPNFRIGCGLASLGYLKSSKLKKE